MADQIRSPEEVNALLSSLSDQILPEGLHLVWLSVDDVKEQDINAQSMPKAMFDQLVSNIRESGAPEGTPLLARTERGSEIVSGHHRVRAARAAGITHMLFFEYENLSRSRIRSKQLAHNSIAGKSDPELVKRIWMEITDVQARFEAFIDPKLIETFDPIKFVPIDVSFDAVGKTIVFAFLSTQKKDIDAFLERYALTKGVDTVLIAERATFEPWIAALKRIQSELDVVVAPSAIAMMARLAMERLDQIVAEKASADANEAAGSAGEVPSVARSS